MDRMTSHRVAYQHHVLATAFEGGADHLGVGVEAGASVLRWQIHADHVVTFPFQQRGEGVPARRRVPSTVNQCECRHTTDDRTEAGAPVASARNVMDRPRTGSMIIARPHAQKRCAAGSRPVTRRSGLRARH